ncbi:MAG: tRNA (N(6)-L-threonylcarbamoyladenosine(37)-C(2))-methylthiotransferase MtaB [Proteobacteria bacterium]|nr:tRNA (N(6)-L-threonylcarbamoyladenosine(37)-C(2))-methylthiotransferase MtaB [Pseudomonadota bacterium]
MSTQNRPDIHTFGCRLNIWESEVMRRHAESAGLNDVVIINTCAVTKEAERQARQAIRKLRREKPQAKIIVTGCAAQIDPDSWAAMPETDILLGNDDKLQPASWQDLAQGQLPAKQVSDIMQVKEVASHLTGSFDDHTRGFLQVQQGCDHRCTFCIIPFGRGPSRSSSIADVVANVRNMVEAGTREIVLSGVDITSWGQDIENRPRLGVLVQEILRNVPELPRLRLSSLDPAEPDNALMEVLASEARLMPHLHLSVQHGDDMILKRMKRRHLARDVIRFCQEARRRRSDVVFGADIIAGFPTEDEAAHQASCQLIGEADLVHLHIFGFSAREGTPAARMPQIEKSVIKRRVADLRALGQEQLKRHLHTRIGGHDMLLLETGGKLCNRCAVTR